MIIYVFIIEHDKHVICDKYHACGWRFDGANVPTVQGEEYEAENVRKAVRHIINILKRTKRTLKAIGSINVHNFRPDYALSGSFRIIDAD